MRLEMKSFIKRFVCCFIAFYIAIMITFKLIFMICLVPSVSMENTLKAGDILIGTRFDRKNIKRYDLMAFEMPDHPSQLYIKRVIGLPGETIVVKDGRVYADGKKLRSDFVKGTMNSSGDGVYHVPEGHYFMMGDNRNNSFDSRFWKHKYVSVDAMKCHAHLRVYPFKRITNHL